MFETTKTMEAMKSVAASQMREEARKRTVEATKSVAEINRKWEEATKKLDEAEQDFMSATKRMEKVAREVGTCVYQVAQGNRDRLDKKDRRKKCGREWCRAQPPAKTQWQVAVERLVSKRRYGSLGVEPEVKVEEGMGPGKLESDNRDHL